MSYEPFVELRPGPPTFCIRLAARAGVLVAVAGVIGWLLLMTMKWLIVTLLIAFGVGLMVVPFLSVGGSLVQRGRPHAVTGCSAGYGGAARHRPDGAGLVVHHHGWLLIVVPAVIVLVGRLASKVGARSRAFQRAELSCGRRQVAEDRPGRGEPRMQRELLHHPLRNPLQAMLSWLMTRTFSGLAAAAEDRRIRPAAVVIDPSAGDLDLITSRPTPRRLPQRRLFGVSSLSRAPPGSPHVSPWWLQTARCCSRTDTCRWAGNDEEQPCGAVSPQCRWPRRSRPSRRRLHA